MATYMKISVCVELPAVLVPDDLGAGLALGHAQEHNLQASLVVGCARTIINYNY